MKSCVKTSILKLMKTYSKLSGRTGNQILVEIDSESILFTFVQTASASLAVTLGPSAGYQACLGKQS